MDYLKLYNAFISKFKDQLFEEDEYTEVHHILPRYAGGTDDHDNLIRLSYKQHVFVHKLWWKATKDVQAHTAYLLMSKIPENKKEFLCSQAGKIGGAKNRESGHIQNLSKLYGEQNGRRNVESGHLDSIRHLANNETQKRKLLELHQKMREDGTFERLAEACSAAKRKKAEEKMQIVIENAVRDERFMQKPSSRNKYRYISPEGLVFSSVANACKYYGNIQPHSVQSWSMWNMAGWSRVLTEAGNN